MMARLRSALAGAGYVLWKKQFLRPGVDPWLDIGRLRTSWGTRVETIFDVGANDGDARREMIRSFPAATIHSFEPHPASFARLSANCRDQRGPLHNIALGNHCGDAAMYEYGIDGDGSQMNSLTPRAGFAVRHEFESRVIEIRSSTLDVFCDQEGVERVDLLKLDTEGFDLEVIQGGLRMFEQNRIGFVYAEFNDLNEREGITGGSLFPMADFLGRHGMRFIATYTDRIDVDGSLWISSNVLFAYPPT